jgi:hypothetical protein
MIGIQVDDARRLKAEVASETGVPADRILLSCSHTHFAPAISPTILADPRWGVVDPDLRFTELVHREAKTCARNAIDHLEPAELWEYRCRVPQVSFNRRIYRSTGVVETSFLYPETTDGVRFQAVDDQLTVLAFKSKAGLTTLLCNFGCHPVAGGRHREKDFYRISADYIRWLRKAVKAKRDSEVLFTLGAAGDSVPMDRGGDSREHIGACLASSLLLGGRANERDPAPVISTWSVDIEVESSFPAVGPGIIEEYSTARDRLLAPDPTKIDLSVFTERLHRSFRARLYPNGTCNLTIQFMKIGKSVLVALPFEVLSATALEIKSRHPGAVIVSCANGYEGYLPSTRQIEEGGYETEDRSMHFVRGTEEKIRALIDTQLSSI